MNQELKIEEGVIYNLFYMGFPVKGYYFSGNWFLMGFIARIIKSLKIHPSGYFLIIYQCSYFKILIRFLLGEYK
ncbi:hypothetical protein [Leptospira noguchii]|uniref:hypothetical protein n=1 Tax=Leptospira noguchii TaxID=28182 RepID=UPI0012F7EF40|nr:hypothetical protein [Leptospira noguchii]UOG50850.1 hypothetical protein MAL00_19455 [Leptospira noguchii]